MSASSKFVRCGIVVADRTMFAAIVLRIFDIASRRMMPKPSRSSCPAGAACPTAALAWRTALMTSSRVMRPSGPVPRTRDKSTPNSRANRRTAGPAGAVDDDCVSAVSVAVSTACESSSELDSRACGGEWPFSSCADGGGDVGRAFVGVVVAFAAGAASSPARWWPWLPAAAMVSRARGLSLPGREISPERRPVSFPAPAMLWPALSTPPPTAATTKLLAPASPPDRGRHEFL